MFKAFNKNLQANKNKFFSNNFKNHLEQMVIRYFINCIRNGMQYRWVKFP